MADPDEVANAIIFLNIGSFDSDLFWLGRAMVSLPTPNLWETVHIDNEQGQIYVDKVSGTRMSIHPCYKFILLILN